MKKSPFYFEIKDIMTQFVSAFNDVIIDRHDRDKNVRSRAHVRYVYAPKQRVVHDLTNKARHITLPVVAVSITGMERDVSRVFNKIEGAYYGGDERNASVPKTENIVNTRHVPQPVPVNIDVSMSILARYQTDVEQIISNFVPYNDPYIILSWKLPDEFTDIEQEIRSEVLWSGNCDISYPDELTANDPYRLSCDTTFTIKTWLFRDAPGPITNIHKITTNITPVNNIDPSFSFSLPFYDDVTERSYIEGLGPSLTAAPFITHVNTDVGIENEVLGYNLATVTGVYLSGNTINALSGENIDKYNKNEYQHQLYPAFTGVKIEHENINDYKIYFDLPEGLPENELLDLIITGPGGYDSAINSTLNGKGIFVT